MKNNKNDNPGKIIKKYKRKFYVVLSLLLLVVLITGIYMYMNYDYLVFKHFIAQHYIYTDTLDKIFSDELKRDVNGKYYEYFDDLVISVVTRKIRQENNDRYTYLFIPEQYEKYKLEEKEEALQSEVKVLNDTTIYIRITNFSKYTRKFMNNNITILKKYPFIIIDLRNNYGGNVFEMNRIADLFLPKKTVLSTDLMRIINWTHKTKKDKILKFNKIIILQNSNSASASENFIAALKDNLNNVTLIGNTTFGKGIGQYTIPLKKGFAVKATTMLWYTPNGINIHGKGIKPDIFYDNNSIIRYALSELLP